MRDSAGVREAIVQRTEGLFEQWQQDPYRWPSVYQDLVRNFWGSLGPQVSISLPERNYLRAATDDFVRETKVDSIVSDKVYLLAARQTIKDNVVINWEEE